VTSKLVWLVLVGVAAGCGPGAMSDPEDVVTNEGAIDALASDEECPLLEDIDSLDDPPAALYRESIRRADDGVRQLAALWPPTSLLEERLRDSLARSGEKASLGFDAYRTTESVSRESYVWCTVEAVLFRGELAMARASCSWGLSQGHATREACLLRRYGASLSAVGLTIDGTRAEARSEFPEVLARMHEARSAQLGQPAVDVRAQPAGDPSHALSEAEELLSDPLARFPVGSMPGRGSTRARTEHEAAQSLVDAPAVDALRRVLRGPNPEGRAYAALGLKRLAALSPEDLRVVELLKGTSTVHFQYGCMGHILSASKFYEKLDAFDWLFDHHARQ
jgi:hypothetical protein